MVLYKASFGARLESEFRAASSPPFSRNSRYYFLVALQHTPRFILCLNPRTMLDLRKSTISQVESALPIQMRRTGAVRMRTARLLATLLAPFYLALWCAAATCIASFLFAGLAYRISPRHLPSAAWPATHDGHLVALYGCVLYGSAVALVFYTHVTLSVPPPPATSSSIGSESEFPAPVRRELGILATVLSVLGGSVAPAIGVVASSTPELAVWDALILGFAGMSMLAIALAVLVVFAVFWLPKGRLW